MWRARMITAIAAAVLLVSQVMAPAARAQTVLRDAETEQFLRDVGTPLMKAAGLDPNSVSVQVVGDSSINAFATLGQRVYFHSGLIIRATDVLELQGVYAHELGHIAGGHAVRFSEGAGPATNISLLGLVAGVALMAVGAGDAGMAAMMASQQAAMGKFLAFSREQETRADHAGAQYLGAAGVDGSGMVSFFRQLQGDEYRLAIPQDNAYNRTHPLSGERISSLEGVLHASLFWGKGADPVLQARYQRIRGKLIGYMSTPKQTLATYPVSDHSVPARMARAYAYHKQARADDAVAELQAALQKVPDDPYLLEMEGQILLESGRANEALPALRKSVALTKGEPLIASMLGHALVETGEKTDDPALYEEAEKVLRASVARDAENPFAWLQLAIIYDRRDDRPRVALATAERLSLIGGDPRSILRSAEVAAAGLPKGSTERLRAEDIVMVARQQVEKMGKKRER